VDVMEMVPLGSPFLRWGFIVFAVLLALGIVWNVYLAGRGLREPRKRTRLFALVAAAGIAGWMAVTWQVAASGVLMRFDQQPPPIVWLVVAVVAVSLGVAFSVFGTRFATGLPLWILVAGQGFRFPLELLMHRAAEEGVMPPQMTYTGWNFDILTGIWALPVAWWLARGGRDAWKVARAWNIIGALLLANIVLIAVLSTPMVAAFGRDRLNVWVLQPPYVWLPTLMVVCAMTGHLVIHRKLRATTTLHL
jgi:hypothetical protein